MFLKSITAPNGYKCFPPNSEFHFLQVPMICIAGENGTGKTTILEMIGDEKVYKEFYYRNYRKIYFIDGLTIVNVFTGLNHDVNYTLQLLNKIPQEIWNLMEITPYLDGNNQLFFIKNGFWLDFIRLSSGEKQLMAIFCMLNYYRDQSQNYSAIILLDEPDIHLNSVWRKKFAGLLNNFLSNNPNIQIIFTTHNLEVLSDMKENEVYICADNKVENITFNPFGMSKEILEKKIFDNDYTISGQVEKDFKEIDRRLKELKTEENKKSYLWDRKLDEIEEEVEAKFASSVIKNELLEKIDNLRGR